MSVISGLRAQLPAGARKRVNRQTTRSALGIFDQGLSSLTNFVTTLLAARITSPSRFGDVALALSIAYMVTILARGLTAEPMMTKNPRLEGAELVSAEQDAMSMAVVIGLVTCVGIAALRLLPTEVTRDFAWVGLCMPAVLVQDALRYVGFSRRRPEKALVSDVAWAIVQFGMLGVVVALHAETVHWIIACWGIGAVAGVVAGSMVLSVGGLGSAKRWFRRTSSYSLWVLPQLGISQGIDQGAALVIVIVFGTAALGGVRAMQVFIRPVFVFMLAVQALLVPNLAWRLAHRGRSGLLQQTRRLALLVGLLALALVSCMVAAAKPLTLHVFGPSYVHYSNLMLPFAVGAVFHACSVVPSAGLRAMQCGRRILMVQVIASAVSIVCVVSAALLSTVYVTCWAIAAQGVAAMIANWIALTTAKGVREAAPAEAALVLPTAGGIRQPAPAHWLVPPVSPPAKVDGLVEPVLLSWPSSRAEPMAEGAME